MATSAECGPFGAISLAIATEVANRSAPCRRLGEARVLDRLLYSRAQSLLSAQDVDGRAWGEDPLQFGLDFAVQRGGAGQQQRTVLLRRQRVAGERVGVVVVAADDGDVCLPAAGPGRVERVLRGVNRGADAVRAADAVQERAGGKVGRACLPARAIG